MLFTSFPLFILYSHPIARVPSRSLVSYLSSLLNLRFVYTTLYVLELLSTFYLVFAVLGWSGLELSAT